MASNGYSSVNHDLKSLVSEQQHRGSAHSGLRAQEGYQKISKGRVDANSDFCDTLWMIRCEVPVVQINVFSLVVESTSPL